MNQEVDLDQVLISFMISQLIDEEACVKCNKKCQNKNKTMNLCDTCFEFAQDLFAEMFGDV